jgi:hypothetical protein
MTYDEFKQIIDKLRANENKLMTEKKYSEVTPIVEKKKKLFEDYPDYQKQYFNKMYSHIPPGGIKLPPASINPKTGVRINSYQHPGFWW